MTRDCRHSTGDDQRLRTYYGRLPETADIRRGGGVDTGFDRYPLPLPWRCPFPLPPRNLLGHVTGPRRLRGHSQSAALLAHAQWAYGWEAASCHSQVPMPPPGEKTEHTAGPRNR
ncbi:unnamed protein product, partial [Staurois parvus]